MQSNEGDEYVVEMSVADSSSNELFNSKKSVMITDSSNGQFQGGQIQFDLSTLASQSSWASLNDAVIEFPISITATQTTAATGGPTIGGQYSAILKNGFSQWIDSVQLVINGQTVQSAQTYENVAAQFRIISQWSQDTLVKYGASCGFALDDLTGGNDPASGQRSLASVPKDRVMITGRGMDTITPYDAATDVTVGQVFRNQGALKRARMLNQNVTGTNTVMSAILGTNISTSGQSNLATVAAVISDTSAPVYTHYMMATVRLADLCDISQFPLVKNLRGYLYLTCNQCDVACASAVAGTFTPSLQSGRTNPFMINIGVSIAAPYGLTLPQGPGIVTYRGRIGNQSTITPIAGSGPVIANGRFIIPTYEANPSIDAILTRSAHEFRTLDKLVDPFVVEKGMSVNRTITVGIPNATRLVLLPMFTKIGGVPWEPEWAPFDSTPATSSPFAYLRDLQVQLGGKSVFNTPIQYDYEAWMAEISKTGRDGGEDSRTSSGLLSQFDWSLNHRFYTVDLSRRLDSEDNSSKSVQVSFTNPSSAYDMKVIALVFFEKRWLLNTATCALQNIG